MLGNPFAPEGAKGFLFVVSEAWCRLAVSACGTGLECGTEAVDREAKDRDTAAVVPGGEAEGSSLFPDDRLTDPEVLSTRRGEGQGPVA